MTWDLLIAAMAGVWFFIPAYIANPSAVLFGGGKPVDGGRMWSDGRRMLGDGKTWKGTLGGGMCGLVLGLILALLAHFGDIEAFNFGSWPSAIAACASLAFGSMFGDIAGSFLKRRIGKERGSRMPFLDQYDFFTGSILFILVINRFWFLERYWHNAGWAGLLTILILTPLFHRTANIVGHKMGKKDVPW